MSVGRPKDRQSPRARQPREKQTFLSSLLQALLENFSLINLLLLSFFDWLVGRIGYLSLIFKQGTWQDYLLQMYRYLEKEGKKKKIWVSILNDKKKDGKKTHWYELNSTETNNLQRPDQAAKLGKNFRFYMNFFKD